MLVLLLAGCDYGLPLTHEQQDELRGLAEQARSEATPLEAARKQQILAAYGTIGPRPDLGACPISVRQPAIDDAGSFADEEGITFELSTTPISVVSAANLAKSDGPRFDRIDDALANDVESMLFAEYAAENQAVIDKGFTRAKALAAPDWLNIDATVVIDTYTAPTITATGFSDGALTGRMYVYDYTKGAIVCAANVRAVNSDRIGVHTHLDDSNNAVGAVSDLVRDLYRNSVENGIASLSSAGPLLLTVDGP